MNDQVLILLIEIADLFDKLSSLLDTGPAYCPRCSDHLCPEHLLLAWVRQNLVITATLLGKYPQSQ